LISLGNSLLMCSSSLIVSSYASDFIG
jgi:hypothetical protein